jgi:hypothetical protein
MRIIFFGFLLAFSCFFKAHAQGDSLARQNKPALNPVDPKTVNPFLPDSVIKANRQKFIADSISTNYLMPDSSRMKNPAIDSLMKAGTTASFFPEQASIKRPDPGKGGKIRPLRNAWIIAVLIGLLVYAGLLNIFFSGELKSIMLSFYNKRSLSQTDKEAGLISTWAFAGLVLLFCLTLGLFLYQLIGYYKKTYPISGFDLFISLAGIVGVLIVLKFILLKFIGFIFDMGGVVRGYIGVLNLTYFSLAFVFLAVAICFSLLARQFIPQLLNVTLTLTIVILLWQYLRNGLGIISDFRFHKFYLFIYLCALEICPVLILIKALNI